MARPSKDKPITLKAIFDLTHRLYWKGTKGEKTALINANTCLKHFGHDCPINEIDTDACDEFVFFLEDEGKSTGTINRKLSALSKMLKTALERGHLEKVPKLRFRTEGDHRIRFLTDVEEDTLIRTCRHWGLESHADFYTVSIETGFREGELLNFQVRDYVPETGMLHLWGQDSSSLAGGTKSGKSRSIPAPARALAIIKSRCEGRKPTDRIFDDLNKWQVISVWRKLRRHMKLDKDNQFIIHALRHTCASRLAMAGVPLAVIQQWLGHATITTTMRYAHLCPSVLSVATDAINKRRESSAEVIQLPGTKVA